MKTLLIALTLAFGVRETDVPKDLQLKAERYAKLQEAIHEEVKPPSDDYLQWLEDVEKQKEVKEESEEPDLSDFDKILDVNINTGDSIIVIKLDGNGFHPVSRGTRAYAKKVIKVFEDKGYKDYEFQVWSVTDDLGKVCSFTMKDSIISEFWLSPAVK